MVFYNLKQDASEEQIGKVSGLLKQMSFHPKSTSGGNKGVDFFKELSQVSIYGKVIQMDLNDEGPKGDLTLKESQRILDELRRIFHPVSYECDGELIREFDEKKYDFGDLPYQS